MTQPMIFVKNFSRITKFSSPVVWLTTKFSRRRITLDLGKHLTPFWSFLIKPKSERYWKLTRKDVKRSRNAIFRLRPINKNDQTFIKLSGQIKNTFFMSADENRGGEWGWRRDRTFLITNKGSSQKKDEIDLIDRSPTRFLLISLSILIYHFNYWNQHLVSAYFEGEIEGIESKQLLAILFHHRGYRSVGVSSFKSHNN